MKKEKKDKKPGQTNWIETIATMSALVAALGLSLGVDVKEVYATDAQRDKIESQQLKHKASQGKFASKQLKYNADQGKFESKQLKHKATQGKFESKQLKVKSVNQHKTEVK